MAVTDFETNEARSAFPCLDEPALKAAWTVRVGRKEDHVSVANMPPVSVGGGAVDGYTGEG